MADPSVPPQQGELTGRRLADRYRFERLVASGGMAQVWEAVDEVLGRSVAVKVLHAHLAADHTFVERFRREAISAARLSHPSIVAIYDTCSSDGMEAIVMELVRGATLRDRIDEREGALDPAEAVAIVGEVAGALEVAHRSGLVHRDVKPANILLCEDHQVKVADFGIAKLPEGTDITQEGTFIGTVRYLAPEQVEGGPVDARTDVYALGAVLYECLCGRAPFDGDTDAGIALARLQRAPLRPRQVRAAVPRPIDEICMQALARRPEDRFQSASDLRAALESTRLAGLHEGHTSGHEPVTPSADDLTGTGPTTSGVPAPAGPPGDDATRARHPGFARRERRWLVPVLLILLIAGALGVAGVLLGRTDAGQDLFDRARGALDGSGDGAATPVAIASASAFDPQGTGGESDSLAPLTIDGDPSTAWRTEGYDTRQFSGLKSGVGVVLTLAEAGTLDRVEVTSPTTGWAAEVYVTDEPGGTLGDWGEPVAAGSGLGGNAVFELGGVEGGSVLVWITDLGDGPPRVRMEISEIVVA